MRFEEQFVVDLPPEEVFRRLVEAERMPEWMHEFEAVEKASEGAPGIGTVYRCRRRKGPAKAWGFRWAAFEPGRKLAWEGDDRGPVRRAGTYTLSPDGNGRTHVHVVLEPKPIFPISLLAPMLQRVLRGHVRRDIDRLKRWLAGTLGGAWVAEAADLWQAVTAALPLAT